MKSFLHNSIRPGETFSCKAADYTTVFFNARDEIVDSNNIKQTYLSKKVSSVILAFVFFMAMAGSFPAFAQNANPPLESFTIFSNGGTPDIQSNIETWIGGHTAITGNIGSNQDLQLNGGPLSGYPAQINGSVYVGGFLLTGQYTIGTNAARQEIVVNGATDNGAPAGTYEADLGGLLYGNLFVTSEETGSVVNLPSGTLSGNLSDVAPTSSGIVGNVTINGSIPSTSCAECDATRVSGTVANADPTRMFTTITLPAPKDLTGFVNTGNVAPADTNAGTALTLVPNSLATGYGALTTTQNQIVNLSSGNYYFESINTAGGLALNIDLTSGNPIKIYVFNNASFNLTTLKVKGAGTGSIFVPISDAQSLAALIYLETQGVFQLGPGGDANNHLLWGGTVYASSRTAGEAFVDVRQYVEWYGAAWSYDSFNTLDHGKWIRVPLAPENPCVVLLSAPTATVTNPTCAVATGTITVNTPTPGTGITYTVTGTSPVVAPVTNSTGIFAGLATGTYNVTTTNAAGCTSSTTSKTIEAQPVTPICPELTGLRTVSSGTEYDYSVPDDFGNYVWSISGNANITSATNSNTVKVLTGSGVSNFTLSLTVTNSAGCFKTCTYGVSIADQYANCETAFARSDDNICFLGDGDLEGDFERWGWTNRITDTGQDGPVEMTLWTGAPVCDPLAEQKGQAVGTVIVSYNSTAGTLDVEYILDPGFAMTEAHVYVGCDKYPTIKTGKSRGEYTVAPGQYNYNALSLNHSYGLKVHFTGVYSEVVWVIAHAVICEEITRASAPVPVPEGVGPTVQLDINCGNLQVNWPVNTTIRCQNTRNIEKAWLAWLASLSYIGGCSVELSNTSNGTIPGCGESRVVTFTVDSQCHNIVHKTVTFTVSGTTAKSAEIAKAAAPVVEFADLKVYPNPFSDMLHFKFVSPESVNARIDLYDMAGRMIKTVFEQAIEAGVSYEAEFRSETIMNEMYFYRMTMGDVIYKGKVLHE